MSAALKAIRELEQVGGSLTLEGDAIRYRVPKDRADVDALVAELRRHRDEVGNLLRERERQWPPASLEAERRFGHYSARLYPLLGTQVRTPRGTGRLVQVFTDRASVLQDRADRVSFFAPEEICPSQLM